MENDVGVESAVSGDDASAHGGGGPQSEFCVDELGAVGDGNVASLVVTSSQGEPRILGLNGIIPVLK